MNLIELAVDLGSANTTIYQKGVGIVLKEPTVAIVQHSQKTTLKYVGNKAKQLIGKTPDNMSVVYPIREGLVINPPVAVALMREYLSRIVPEGLFRKQVRILATIDSGATVNERRSVESVFHLAGYSDVVIVDSPLAMSRCIPQSTGLVVDMGAGTTQASIVSSEGIIAGLSVNMSGDSINNEISDYLLASKHLKTGPYTAEKIKLSVASMYDNDISDMEISGIDTITGSAVKCTLTASDLYPIIKPTIDDICQVITTTLNQSPADMLEQIYDAGIYLCGGASLLVGLKEYIENKLKIKVNLLPDPTNVVINGAGTLLADKNTLSTLMHFDDK